MRIHVNGPPCVYQWTPRLRKKKHGSLCKSPPPLSKEETRPGPLTWGGGVVWYPYTREEA